MSTVLTKDELTLLALLSHGMSTDRVARRLGLSERTVRRRIRAICDRLGVATPVEAVVWAARRQLV
jgi:DNA-binding NarL/FixJ family response regulator